MKIFSNNNASQQLGKAIVIIGIPRSGTSITSKLIGSFATVEFSFEPPLVHYLNAIIKSDNIKKDYILDLFETYLFYEHFVENTLGRRYNFRSEDMSYILDMKSKTDITRQWEHISGFQDALSEIDNHTHAIKFVGGYDLFTELYKRHPDIRFVHIYRDLDRILASMFEKNWYSDNIQTADSIGRPYYKDNSGSVVPYLVAKEKVQSWNSMNVETRTVHICNQLADKRSNFRHQFSGNESYYELDFDRFVHSTDKIMSELLNFLDLKPGAKTHTIVNKIRPTEPSNDADRILERCDSDEAKRYKDLRGADLD